MYSFDKYCNLVLEAHAGVNATNAAEDEARGEHYENLFEEICRQNKLKCKKADRYEETVLHFDYKVLDKGEPAWSDRPENKGKVAGNKACYVEVKNAKNHFDPNYIFLEFRSNKGYNGWMYGEANYIAFYNDSTGGFDMVKRHTLLKEVENLGLFAKKGQDRREKIELFYTTNKQPADFVGGTLNRRDAFLTPNREAVFYSRRNSGNIDMSLYVPKDIVMNHKTFEINPTKR